MELRGRVGISEDHPSERIACADLFKRSVLLAAGPKEEVINDVTAAVSGMITAGRPKRERKPRVL